MNLGEFHTLIGGEVGKASTHTANIPERVRMAVLWIERNHALKYMERYVTFTLTSRTIVLPGEPKNFLFVRTMLNADWKYLRQIDPREVLNNDAGIPNGYWLDGTQNLVFDAYPGTDLAMELSYNQRTTWGTADNYTHWLLEWATDVVLAKTMQLMSTRARQVDWQKNYGPMLVEGLKTLLLDDEELRNSNREYIMGGGIG